MKGFSSFPSPESADEYGIVAWSEGISVELVIDAYQHGIFPWPLEAQEMVPWFSPKKRAVLFFDDFKVSKSLQRAQKKAEFTFAINSNFRRVIEACARSSNRGDRGTWITEDIISVYTELHRLKFCHSVECYQNGELVGGLYGVSIGKMFAGESMFYLEPNASKLCLCYLVEYLQSKGGIFLDCQQLTLLLKSFGAIEINREDFLTLLNEAVETTSTVF